MFRRSWTLPASGTRRRETRAAAPHAPGPAGAPRATPTLKDDAAHAAAFAKHWQREWYTEWWYMNLRDEASGLALLGTYGASPYNGGFGSFGALVFVDGETPRDALDLYPASQVTVSEDRPHVVIGPSSLVAENDDTYRFVAQSRDGRIAWDLTFTRAPGAPPAWLLDNAQGPLPWEQGFWLSWLPRAVARGTVTVDGKVYTLTNATAYHDHNWGVWLSPARNWQWLQCSSLADGIALDLGYADGFDPGSVALLELDGETVMFEASGIDLPVYTGFATWPGTPWKYPASARTTLLSKGGDLKVEVEWTARPGATAPLYTPVVLFEQYVDVTLRIERKGSSPREVKLTGIAEWSDSYLADWSQPGEGLSGAYHGEVTVFGGGITGLSAAQELAERGFTVTVVEPEQALDLRGERRMALGGMARSHYARVPRLGAPPRSRPAGRPTPSARNDAWTQRSVPFAPGSVVLGNEGEQAAREVARAYLATYVEQGYRLTVRGAAASGEAEPQALAARRAEAVRDALVTAGVAVDCVHLARGELDARPAATMDLEDYVLPGEHGFRFFPGYYRHVTDTMARIPVYDAAGRVTGRRVRDNLVPLAGQGPETALHGSANPLATLRLAVETFARNAYDPRDFLQMGLRLARYLATCPERRAPLEDLSWWNYLCGYSPKTGCSLYRYSNAFTLDATNSGRVLAAFDWRYGDARTNGSTFVQLFEPLPDASPTRVDSALDGPTTEAWLDHWRRYLEERGVQFVAGRLERIDLERVHGEDVVVPWVARGDGPPEPWAGRTRGPRYVVVATDAGTAERASAPLPKVGVPKGLVGYTTRFDGKPRDPYRQPGLGPSDRLQTLSGVQFYFDQDFALGGEKTYSRDAPWALSSLSQQRIWSRLPFTAKDGYTGLLSVDIGNFAAPAGPTQRTAWDSSYERIGEQVWLQIEKDLVSSPFGPAPIRRPQPTWFHVDDNLEFGDRDGLKNVVVRNSTPYLVPIVADWRNRPGPSPFDPNVPDATRPEPPEPGVWQALHGGYPVHWGTLLYAGIYLKTFTRMTTMESANESARHAVNAILDHFNAHHGATVAPPNPSPYRHPDPFALEADEVPAPYLGDYCGIWNIERYETASYDGLKAIDQILFDLGLPHLFDLLGVEVLPSILSHLFPYRGDGSLTGNQPPPPEPPPGRCCPPFLGATMGRGLARVAALFTRRK